LLLEEGNVVIVNAPVTVGASFESLGGLLTLIVARYAVIFMVNFTT
jgi:hypothetical protein